MLIRKKEEFKKLCKNKEEQKKKMEEEEIRKAKSERQIWEHINRERKRKTVVKNKIHLEVWKDHFMNLLGGSEERKETARREHLPMKEDEEKLTQQELEKQLKKLKKEKAPGGDIIPNEAWIYCEGNTRNKLKKVISVGRKRLPRGLEKSGDNNFIQKRR